jgi:hypothetical protein
VEDLSRADTMTAFHEVLAAHRVAMSTGRFLVVEMDVANKCNLRCRMCYFSNDATFTTRACLSRLKFSAVATGLLPHTRTLQPVARERAADVAPLRHDPADGDGVRRLTMFYTNGTLLTDELIATIIDCRVTDVCISIDGATKETYEDIRQGADFNRLLHAASGRLRLGAVRSGLRRRGSIRRRHDAAERPRARGSRHAGVRPRRGRDQLLSHGGIDGLNMEQVARAPPGPVGPLAARALVKARELGVIVTAHPTLFASRTATGPRQRRAVFSETPYCTFPSRMCR